MMNYYEAVAANMDQLTDELAAAGWDSSQQSRHEALTAVIALIAEMNPNSLPAMYHDGYAAAEAGDLREPHKCDEWQHGYSAFVE